jgi:hypothetical protein
MISVHNPHTSRGPSPGLTQTPKRPMSEAHVTIAPISALHNLSAGAPPPLKSWCGGPGGENESGQG